MDCKNNHAIISIIRFVIEIIFLSKYDVGVLITRAKKITMITLSQKDKKVSLDNDAIKEQPGFYVKDLSIKHGVYYCNCSFPISTKSLLWYLLQHEQEKSEKK